MSGLKLLSSASGRAMHVRNSGEPLDIGDVE
jgi:hypothetical protein